MGANLLEKGGVIVSPKRQPVQVKFRWDPELAAEIKDIAARTNRTVNEAGELLMRWAIERCKAELEMQGQSEQAESPLKRKKQ